MREERIACRWSCNSTEFRAKSKKRKSKNRTNPSSEGEIDARCSLEVGKSSRTGQSGQRAVGPCFVAAKQFDPITPACWHRAQSSQPRMGLARTAVALQASRTPGISAFVVSIVQPLVTTTLT